jgi:uncharacterized protein YecE (DUF72 family)
MTAGRIRVGVGGWTFEPWRGVFYPKGLRQADELAYAASHLAAIEINGTYYSTFKPDSFAKWRAATPDGFQFTVKASRFCTNRKVLAEMGSSMQVFLNQGLVELGDRLGPILWQFMGTKRFDPADFEGFLKLLPDKLEGLPLRHAVEPRHESFRTPEFVAMCRRHKVAVVLADHESYPLIPDVTADFVYARLQTGSDEIETAYAAKDPTPGRNAFAATPRAASRATWRPSIRRTRPPPRRATSTPSSFTKGRYAPPPPP